MRNSQPSPGDRRRMRELSEAIGGSPLGQNPLGLALPELHSLLGLDNGCTLTVKVIDDRRRLGVDFLATVGLAPARVAAARSHLEAAYARTSWGQGTFNALNPDPRQRNVFLTSPEAVRLGGGLNSRVRRAQQVFPLSGMRVDDQLRALICDRNVLLGYITLGRAEPFSTHERALVTTLIPALRRRLLLNRQVVPVDLLVASLEASLEAIGSPAFITSTSGKVLHANAAGRARLGAERRATQELLAARMEGKPGGGGPATRIAVPGLREHWLVILRDVERRLAEQALRAATLWRLTPRQTEVLSLVIRGLANASIAQVLGCTGHTVALHVSAILDRAGVDSRAALAAAVAVQ